jgi:hypothetical protein
MRSYPREIGSPFSDSTIALAAQFGELRDGEAAGAETHVVSISGEAGFVSVRHGAYGFKRLLRK